MKIGVTGHGVHIGDSLRGQFDRRIEDVANKYFGDALEAHVRVSREGARYRSQVSVHVGKDLFAEGHGEDADIATSFNVAVERVETQLRRSKRKRRQHH